MNAYMCLCMYLCNTQYFVNIVTLWDKLRPLPFTQSKLKVLGCSHALRVCSIMQAATYILLLNSI